MKSDLNQTKIITREQELQQDKEIKDKLDKLIKPNIEICHKCSEYDYFGKGSCGVAFKEDMFIAMIFPQYIPKSCPYSLEHILSEAKNE